MLIVVIVLAKPLTLFATDPIANLFLLAIALILAYGTLLLATVTFVLALIGTTTFLASVLSVIRISKGRGLNEAE